VLFGRCRAGVGDVKMHAHTSWHSPLRAANTCDMNTYLKAEPDVVA
jgi:hypothetical protein